MKKKDFDTLVDATNYLMDEGYTESFKATDAGVTAMGTKKTYNPADLLITGQYRFEGMSNPADSVELMAIKAIDGIKGTLVLSYGAKHSQNTDVIKKIPLQEDK